MKRPHWVILAATASVFLAAVLIGLAVGGTTQSAARALVFVFGAAMLGLAAFMLSLALQTRHAHEDWTVLLGWMVLRVGAGVSAIWLALGGGAVAAWTLVAFLVCSPVWGTVMRRRRGIS